MKRAIIFANGNIEKPPPILQSIQPGDLLIAADGGTHHCLAYGITPTTIIGDFDSLEAAELRSLQKAGVETIRHPSHKDETDLELALGLALERAVDEVYIVGGLGARWDMTIANILLLAQARFSGLKIHLVDGELEIFMLKGEDKVELFSRAGASISLIPLGGEASGISTEGLEYALADETLYFGSPRGVSNQFVQDHARISLKAGRLLCIYSKG